MEERIRARYWIETAFPLEQTAETMAGEQSTGTFTRVPGETDELRAHHAARVESIRELDSAAAPSLPGAGRPKGAGPIYRRAEVEISWPLANLGASLPNLLATVAGNLWELKPFSGMRLLDVELPPAFLERYCGPQFGVAGTRRLWRSMFCMFAVLGVTWAALWRWWFHDEPAQQPGITAEELAEIGTAARRGQNQGIWRALLRSRQTWLLVGMYWCYVWGSWFYFSWFPTFLMRGKNFSEREMRVLSALPFVLGCAGNLTGGWLSDRLAARYGLKVARCGQASASLAIASLLILGLAMAKEKAAVVVLSSLAFGVLDLMLPAAWSLCLDLGQAHAGLLTGTMNTAGLAGGFVCTVLFGYLVRATGSYRLPLCVIAGAVMLSAVLFALIDPHHPVWKDESV